jgi:hypothetical protein
MPMRRRHDPAVHPARLFSACRAALALVGGLALSLLGGCAWWEQHVQGAQEGVHVISLHYFADPTLDASNQTQIVSDANGTQRFCIRRVPIVSNREIMGGKLEITGDPERPALRVLLDRHGSVVWLQACQQAPGDRVAVVLDGFLWYTMELPRPTDTHSILLDGPLGKVEAQAIIDAIPGHYRKYNGKMGIF